MALPTILIDSATGSDTQASGAGPSTALFGTTDASFSAATVTLTAGTDLTNVATDGSHVLYLLTSTGVRFFKITAKAGSGGATPTVDVTPNPAGTSTGRTWAIGGKRASLLSSSSILLLENASGDGDAMPGWTMEMASGHSESGGTRVVNRRAGNTTSGPITIQGASGAATLPLLTYTANDDFFLVNNDYWVFRDFEMRNSNGTKTASYAIRCNVTLTVAIHGVKVSHATDYFYRAIGIQSNRCRVTQCEVGFCANIGIALVGTSDGTTIQGCYAHDNGSHGIGCASGGLQALGLNIMDNICDTNGGDGIHWDLGADGRNTGSVKNNTCYNNTSDGIEITNNTSGVPLSIVNNILKSNGGYGINFAAAGAPLVQAVGALVDANVFHGNTSGTINLAVDTNSLTTDPNFVNAGSGDFTPQEATLEGTAFPTSIP